MNEPVSTTEQARALAAKRLEHAERKPCPVCKQVFTAVGRARYCSAACRQKAARQRQGQQALLRDISAFLAFLLEGPEVSATLRVDARALKKRIDTALT